MVWYDMVRCILIMVRSDVGNVLMYVCCLMHGMVFDAWYGV